ncbi:hypothetical protein [Rubidibacter lacunae]|uniref:hypothetical protein n=1 Tax=Rubidibacter lacunae TaxID=582514 RepID=UPI0012EB816F|nr:hypothetical protein [Rubidibacter lacunae]
MAGAISVSTIAFGTIASSDAVAGTYSGRCYHSGSSDFKGCDITIESELTLSFGKEEFQDENAAIAEGSISRIATEDASNPVPVIRTPLNKTRQQYLLTLGAEKQVAVRVNLEDAPQFQQELTQFSGQYVNFPVPPSGPYNGRCFHAGEQDMKSCFVSIAQSETEVIFEKEEYQYGNVTIPKNAITAIASGNYAKRLMTDTGSIIGSLLIGPASFISRQFYDKEYQQYVLDYTQPDGDPTSIVLRLRRRDATVYQQGLTVITGRYIGFEEPQTDTAIDVGPDFLPR